MRRILLSLALVLAACGADGSGPEPDPGTPLLQIGHIGGFAPADFFLTRGPTYTLTRDGRLISPGAVPAIFPGPLVMPHWVSQVTPGEMGQIERMIGSIGLPDMIDERDDDNPGGVADAPTTVVTYWDDDGQAHRYSVYALGIQPNPRREARELQELITVIETLAGRDATEWVAEQYQFVALPGALDPEFSGEMDWPLEETVDTWDEINGLRCAVLGADDLPRFAEANQATTFPSPDPAWADVFRLAVRPLHPGETGCEVPG
jgi:hypothetical protein